MRTKETLDLDLSKLYTIAVEKPTMTKQASATRLKYAGNEQRFSRVGFDLFRETESEYIWKLEKDSESGEEFIYRTAAVDSRFKSNQNWSTEVDSGKSAITLVYKGQSIKAFKKAELQFDEANVEDWRRFLVDKITTDPSFLNKILANLGDERRKYILGQHPELTK